MFKYVKSPTETFSHACNCVGPQNDDPVCPCMMRGHVLREAGARALDILLRSTTKPRVRVKAGRRAA